MDSRLPRAVFSGTLGGTLVGLLIGAYVVVLSVDHVLHRGDFSVPIHYEQSKSRYVSTVLLAFVATFAAIGPFVAFASFGGWIRHAVYGLVVAIGTVVFVTLVAAAITGQQPINMMKGSPSTYIDVAREYAIPVAILVGPIFGILVGRLIGRRGVNFTPCDSAN